jgi:excisionase family DNA binding protein
MARNTDNRLADQLGDAADNLGISRSKLETLIGRGIVNAVKSGRITLVSREEQRRYLKSLPPAVMTDRSATFAKRKAAARAREAV